MKRQNEQIKGNVSTQDKGCFFLTMDFENLTHFLSKGCLRAWPGGTSQQLTAAQACSLEMIVDIMRILLFHKHHGVSLQNVGVTVSGAGLQEETFKLDPKKKSPGLP